MSSPYRRLTLKLHEQHDADLYDWSLIVPSGELATHIKLALREYLAKYAGQQVEVPPPPPPPPRQIAVPAVPDSRPERASAQSKPTAGPPRPQAAPVALAPVQPEPIESEADDDTLAQIDRLGSQF